jgi:hypothetical protein
MSEIQVIDNFLEKKEFDRLQSLLMNAQFPWHYSSSMLVEPGYNFKFTHIFYEFNIPTSNFFNEMDSFVDKLNIYSIIRIKSNLLTKTNEIKSNGWHCDLPDEPSSGLFKTSVFYINTNNGYTVFENGKKINSVENRMLVFPSNIKHQGTTCTDENIRVVINFNYLEGK